MKMNWYKTACGVVLTACLALLLTVTVSAHKPPDPAAMEQQLRQQLDKLVASAIITPVESQKILGLFNRKLQEFQADQEKFRQMSPQEQQAAMKQHCQDRCTQPPPDLRRDLTEIAGLTPDKAKTVADALRPPRPPHAPPDGKDPKGPDSAAMERHLQSRLTAMVTADTIEQTQADKIIALFRQKAAERQAEQERIAKMTPAERRVDRQSGCLQRCNRPDPTKELSDAAGLTSEQAKTLLEALRPPHHPGSPPGGGSCPPPPEAPPVP